ncbi:MAG TPA: alpha/beta hydrolase [Galbitalea sp.]|jgi:pimeloyl-ACP methyl ester carboxylesterase|nr:alpha/beta hydrolase [Galbitalea sp.]
MSNSTTARVETEFRTSESALYGHYGLQHTERFVQLAAPSIKIRVVEIGDDSTRPPILLLHGIASVTAAAIPLLPLLGGRRILAVDWPGHGLSDPLVLGRHTDLRAQVVSVIDTVLDDFGAKTVDIVAHSLGGQFALYYVLARPNRVRRLVLLGAPGAGFEGVQPVAAMRVMAIPGIGRGILSLPASPAAYKKNSEGMLGAGALDGYPDEVGDVGYYGSQRTGFPSSLASFFRALITPFSVRKGVAVPAADLATITTPTLMVWGDKDVFLTPAHGRANLEAIQGSQLLVVDGGHAPWLNELELTGSTILKFLDG